MSDYTESPEGQHALAQAEEDARVDAERLEVIEARHTALLAALASLVEQWQQKTTPEGYDGAWSRIHDKALVRCADELAALLKDHA